MYLTKRQRNHAESRVSAIFATCSGETDPSVCSFSRRSNPRISLIRTIELSPFQIGQRRVDLVFIGQNQLCFIERLLALERGPSNTYLRVVPHETALVAGMVEIIAFIAELGGVA